MSAVVPPNNAGAWSITALVLAFLLAFTIPTPADEPRPVDPVRPEVALVHDNGGGIVGDFLEVRDQWIAAGTKVRISGYCASACTLFLGVPDVCVEPDARLLFHAPFFMPLENVRVYNSFMTVLFTAEYPPAIQQWIVSKGGLGPDWIILEGSELLDLVPLCD